MANVYAIPPSETIDQIRTSSVNRFKTVYTFCEDGTVVANLTAHVSKEIIIPVASVTGSDLLDAERKIAHEFSFMGEWLETKTEFAGVQVPDYLDGI